MRRCAALLVCALAIAVWPGVAGAAPGARGTVAERAREQARDVLSERRFAPSQIPQPLRRPRERIGEVLRSLGRPVQSAFEWLAHRVPGGETVLLILLGLAVGGAAVALARRAANRAALGPAGAAAAAGAGERLSAARLREQAEAAEARCDLDAALRLRFRAGLVELDSRELIELRPALTNRELLRDLPSPTLAGLVDGFEAVAYGGRAADPGDLRSARDGWPQVVEEAAAR